MKKENEHSPGPSPHEALTQPETNMDYWKTVLQSLPESYREWFLEERSYLQERITPGDTVIEIGCGDGRSIHDVLPVTDTITGIDHDDAAVEKAKQAFKDNENIHIHKADATDLPFDDTSFDVAMCMTTFANFGADRAAILSEVKRVLKHTGKFIVSVFSEDALEERMKVYESVGVDIIDVDDRGKVTFDESLGANVSEQFSEEELRTIFAEAEFDVEDIKKVGIAYLCTLRVSSK